MSILLAALRFNSACWLTFHAFVVVSRSDDFFSKLDFSKKNFSNTIRVSNSLNPDQANILPGLIWVQIVCKDYQQIAKNAASKEKVNEYFTLYLKVHTLGVHIR